MCIQGFFCKFEQSRLTFNYSLELLNGDSDDGSDDGSVKVYSEGVGRGSCFTARAPLETQSLTKNIDDKNPLENTAAAHKILIIEDNIDVVAIMKSLLALLCQEVYLAHNGYQDLKITKKLTTTLVICDTGLRG